MTLVPLKHLVIKLVRTKTRFVDCTSQTLKSTFACHEEEVVNRWETLFLEMSPCLSAFPHDGDIQANCTSKNKYVRSWAWLQTKCARCGRRSMPSRRLDGSVDTNRYLHLCDWLTKVEPRRRTRLNVCEEVSPE